MECRAKKILKYGENNYRNGSPCRDIRGYGNKRMYNTEHSEISALKQLKYISKRGRKNPISIDLIVIRLTNSCQGESKRVTTSNMCLKCIEGAIKIPPKYGYRIRNVVYSNSKGKFEKISLKKLKKMENHHVSRFYKRAGFARCSCK